jgi:glucokinase
MLLGFDIGGTKCAVILGDNGNSKKISIIDKVVLPTNIPAEAMIKLLLTRAEAIIERNGATNSLTGIGISCGGPLNSRQGIILSPPNLPGWDNIPIVEMTEKRFGAKAFLQNDANACAVAEWEYGAGVGFRNIIFLTFGTGMGAGLILDGQLYSGTTDHAGEVGHIRMAEIGPVGFGKAGSFEGFCSGGGIAQLGQIKAREKLQMGEKVSFCNSTDDLLTITAKSIADAAFGGDQIALDVYETSARFLGRGLAVLIDILNPEIIILGGMYGKVQPLMEPMMNEVIRAESLSAGYNSCRIVPSLLAENIGDMAALVLADAAGKI